MRRRPGPASWRSVLATTNLLLAANQMFWTLLNPLLTGAGVLTKSGSGTLTINGDIITSGTAANGVTAIEQWENARDAMAVRRFLREARLASQLSQPNTVSVFDFGQIDDGRLFIAMELIEGVIVVEIEQRRLGGGFGGVGALVMLKRAGYDDVTVFERGWLSSNKVLLQGGPDEPSPAAVDRSAGGDPSCRRAGQCLAEADPAPGRGCRAWAHRWRRHPMARRCCCRSKIH